MCRPTPQMHYVTRVHLIKFVGKNTLRKTLGDTVPLCIAYK